VYRPKIVIFLSKIQDQLNAQYLIESADWSLMFIIKTALRLSFEFKQFDPE
jgi:hypothetical protein